MINKRYNEKYYNRHFIKYRDWENKVGEYLYKELKPNSVLDLGCGVGSYLEGFFNSGCKYLLGIELSYNQSKKYIVNKISSFIIEGDVTKDLDLGCKFDCVISFEVGEHIKPDGTEIFINNLTSYSDKYIILTAAPPGQRGTGHINLRNKDFWIDAITSKGFLYEEKLVEKYKKSWKEFNVGNYILNNLMVFKKEEYGKTDNTCNKKI